MNTFWINDISILFSKNKFLEVIPTSNMKITDKLNYLNKEIRHETRMLESYENAFKNVLGNKIGIENITKIMRGYK